MTTGQIIKNRRKELNMSAEFLAERMGVHPSTIYRYEKGEIDKMPIDILAPISKVLRTTPAELMGWNDPEASKFQKIVTHLPLYNIPVAAGSGTWLSDGCEYEYKDFGSIPNEADFALRVRGDSMEPMYSDGDIVFIKSNIIVESGQIGVFCLNNEGFLKMLQGNKLISLNQSYKPIIIGEYDSFFCAGRVVGKA